MLIRISNLFLVSLSILFSLAYKNHSANSLKKVVSHAQTSPAISLDTIELDDWSIEFEIEENTFLFDFLKPDAHSFSFETLKTFFNFSYIKNPLLYFLFAIPPPLS